MAKQSLQEELGDNLVSLISYEKKTKQLVVVKKASVSILKIISLATKQTPLVLREKDIMQGMDVFPIDFLHIAIDYQVDYGKDVFAKINFKKKDLRQQLEFDIRSKLIVLRTRMIQDPKNGPKQIIQNTTETILPIMQGLCVLKLQRIKDTPTDPLQVFAKAEELYGLNTDILHKIYKRKITQPTKAVQELIDFFTDLCDSIDTLLVP